MTSPHQHLIAFVGLSGSGKTAATQYVKCHSIPVVSFGDVIRSAMNQAGIETTWENQQEFRETIRQREGKEFVVTEAIKQIHHLLEAGQHRLILDGLYTWPEYRALKHEFPGLLTVVAVVAPKHLRYRRMQQRPERPMLPHEVEDRDWSEIENLEKGGPIAIADHYIINDGSIEKLHAQIDTILHDIDFLS